MRKLMFMLVATAGMFGPIAMAQAAVSDNHMPTATDSATTTTPSQNSYESARVNQELMALNDEVQSLEQQNMIGTSETPQLAGVIPHGG
ncbi:hypothetical protein [Acidocella sp.]|uniref:hypothetical protein n=1 Tax=Acidocella sp. TaxID=50710 RepID=UPI002F4175A8